MIEQFQTRRSIRKYLDQPVEESKIWQLLESARLAPSGSNTQPWHFIVVRGAATRQRLTVVAHNQQWMLTAPVFIVCVADIRSRIKAETTIALDETSPEPELKQIIRDTAIAVEHILLEATNQGLGSCWVAMFDQAGIRPVLNIPVDKYVLGIVTIGYPDEQPAARPRKSLETIIHNELW
jgi:nitroreductase